MADIFRNNNAKAIWIDCEKKQNRYVKFQTEFTLENEKEVMFCISSDKQYELYINGKMASFGQYGDFPKEKVYDCVDVTPYVKEGKNLVSIIGFSNGKDSFSHLSGIPMVIFAAMADEKCLLVSDENVKCTEETEFVSGEFEEITGQLTYNFGFDLRNDDGFREKNVSETWQNAIVCDDSEVTYIPRPLRKIELKDVCTGEIITQGEFQLSDGETVAEKMQQAFLAYRDKEIVIEENTDSFSVKKDSVFWISDLGEEMAGYITIDVEAEDGAIIDIAYGEHLNDMRVRSSVGGRNFAFRTVCREGRQKISFYIHRLACRYLEVFAHKGVRKVYTLGLHRTEYPLNYNELHLNDSLYNKIYEISQQTLMLCMHEHYEDCPWREQALYGMDSRNQMLAGYYAFGETDMPGESLRLLAKSQKDSGLFEITAPATFHKTIPSFSLAWISSVSEYVLFSGDTDFAQEMLPVAKKVLEFFKIDSDKKLVITPTEPEAWNFYEWTEGMNNWDIHDLRYDAPLNAFYMISLRNYLKLCTWSENEAEALWAQERIDALYDGFHKAFYCEDVKAYRTQLDGKEPYFNQLTQAWALYGGCVPEEYCDAVRESLLNDDFIESSLSHSVYKYDALLQDPEKYADIVLKDITEKWGHMLYSGATSFWETMLGEADFSRAGSLCHGWSATPAYIFWRYILGVYPTSPGVLNVSEEPCCSKDFVAEGTLKIKKGTYKASLKNGKTQLELM